MQHCNESESRADTFISDVLSMGTQAKVQESTDCNACRVLKLEKEIHNKPKLHRTHI